MPFFCDAYLGDTMDLSLEEHGAYLKLLMVTWRNNGQPLPDDDKRMARILGVSVSRWVNKIRPALTRFFLIENGSWRQLRLEKEWQFVQKFSAKQSANVNERWKKNRDAKSLEENNTEDTNVSTKTIPDRYPQSQSQSQIDGEEKESPSSSQDAAREKPPLVKPDQIAVIRAFDAAIVKHWGAAQARPNPAATDCVTAQAYLEAGADLDLLSFVFETQCQKMAHAQKRPPGTLKYFERTVLEVIAEGKRPPLKAQAAGGNDEGRYFGPDGQWRKRVENFLESGFWRDAWGAKPGDSACAVPAHVLEEFADRLNRGEAA